MPTYLVQSHYESIRRALGLAGDDSTRLPDATIEDRLFLAWVERQVGAQITALVIDMDDADTAAWVLDGIILMTASRLAEYHEQAGLSEEISSERWGGTTAQYRETDWSALAVGLQSTALRAFAEASASLANALGGPAWDGESFMGLAGPSREEEDSGETPSVDDQLTDLEPFILRGS